MNLKDLERLYHDEGTDPFSLILAEGLAIVQLTNAELTGDQDKIRDAKAAYEELTN